MSIIQTAINRHKKGDDEAAIRLCHQILLKTNNDIDARILLALIHGKAGDHATATHQLNYSMRTQPRFEKEGFSNVFGFSYEHLAESLKLSANAALVRVSDKNRTLVEISLAMADHIIGNLDEGEQRYRHCMTHGYDPYLALIGLAFIRQQRGDDEGYRELIDYAQFPVQFDLVAEKGPDKIAELNETLYQVVIEHPSLSREVQPEAPASKFITEHFTRETAPGPLAELLDLIEEKVEHLKQEMTPVPGNPVLNKIPSRYETEIFGALLDRSGHHSPHVHTDSWLSGGYYARVPNLAADGDEKAGFLEFGKLCLPTADGFEGERHYVDPHEGLLVMWPSFYIHNTVPVDDSRQRLTMGFNVYSLD